MLNTHCHRTPQGISEDYSTAVSATIIAQIHCGPLLCPWADVLWISHARPRRRAAPQGPPCLDAPSHDRRRPPPKRLNTMLRSASTRRPATLSSRPSARIQCLRRAPIPIAARATPPLTRGCAPPPGPLTWALCFMIVIDLNKTF